VAYISPSKKLVIKHSKDGITVNESDLISNLIVLLHVMYRETNSMRMRIKNIVKNKYYFLI